MYRSVVSGIYTSQYPDLYKKYREKNIKIQAKFIQASTRTCIKIERGKYKDTSKIYTRQYSDLYKKRETK